MKKTMQERLDKFLEGSWVITGVGVVDRYNYLVVAEWWDPDNPENLYETKSGEDSWTKLFRIDVKNEIIKGKVSHGALGKVHCDGGRTEDNMEAFFASWHGITYYINYRKETFEHEDLLMHPDKIKAGTSRGSNDVKLIGNHFYMADSRNEVHRRDASKKWTLISAEAKEYYKKIGDDGAKAIAAFNENEIYFSGDDGSLWYYDGKHWDKILGIPKDMNLRYLECSEDSKVYAVDKHARGVAVGRGKEFRFLPMKTNDPAKGHLVYDACTFNGKMYITDGDIYEFRDDHWVKANIPDVYGSVEHLAAKDGVMFIGTPYSLKIYNGKETFTLYGESKETEKLFGKQAVELALELIDKKDEIKEIINDKKH